MKIYVSLAMALLFLTVNAGAQHVNIGIKGGLNLYNIKNDNGAKYETKAGFNAGLIGHIHLDKQFALQPELVYSGQGAKYTTAGVETKLNLGYINIPVLFQYMFDNGFRIQAGPQVGLDRKSTRLKQIKNTDRSDMTKVERKELRKEVKDIRKEIKNP